jgi:hypothetical protein
MLNFVSDMLFFGYLILNLVNTKTMEVKTLMEELPVLKEEKKEPEITKAGLDSPEIPLASIEEGSGFDTDLNNQTN